MIHSLSAMSVGPGGGDTPISPIWSPALAGMVAPVARPRLDIAPRPICRDPLDVMDVGLLPARGHRDFQERESIKGLMRPHASALACPVG
jgi:hypothetical protein